MAAKIYQLESTIMELGTEMFRLKHQISDMQHMQAQFVKTINGLKGILDEKGVINAEDFDMAVDVNQMVEKADRGQEREAALPSPKKELH